MRPALLVPCIVSGLAFGVLGGLADVPLVLFIAFFVVLFVVFFVVFGLVRIRALSTAPTGPVTWLARNAGAQARLSTRAKNEVFALYADPEDRSIAWLRTRNRGRMFGVMPIDVDMVSRHHVDVHGCIDESRYAAAL